MKFLSYEVMLDFCKMFRCCMKCLCHVWAGDPNCYMEMVDKLSASHTSFEIDTLKFRRSYPRKVFQNLNLTEMALVAQLGFGLSCLTQT